MGSEMCIRDRDNRHGSTVTEKTTTCCSAAFLNISTARCILRCSGSVSSTPSSRCAYHTKTTQSHTQQQSSLVHKQYCLAAVKQYASHTGGHFLLDDTVPVCRSTSVRHDTITATTTTTTVLRPFVRDYRVSRYQKDEPFWILLKQT